MKGSFRFSLATPPGEGGFAFFELYGDGARSALEQVFRARRAGTDLPELGASRLGSLVDAAGDAIDEVLVGRLPAEGSWSRLPCWTLSIHGGLWLEVRTRERLIEVGGVPEERRDTLRASLEAGALSATEAAAIEGLVDCETERAAAFLLRMAEGELHRALDGCIARIDAGTASEEIADALDAWLQSGREIRGLLEPRVVLLAGRPNAGKSTLFNRLVETDRVLVSEQAGTTRDSIRETIAIDGLLFELVDTAGVREEPGDAVEAEAIRRVRQLDADLVVWLLAPPFDIDPGELDRLAAGSPPARLVVASFCDRAPGPASADLSISALVGEGLDALRARLVLATGGRSSSATHGEPVDPTAPFTEEQCEALAAALRAARSGNLDAVRQHLVTCRDLSWPPRRDLRPASGLR